MTKDDKSSAGKSYAEGTPLTQVFGDSPKTKIIAALLSEYNRDINISDISRLSGVSRSAIYDHIDQLVDIGIVKQTRKMGGSKLYQINTDSEIVQHIADIEAKLAAQCDPSSDTDCKEPQVPWI